MGCYHTTGTSTLFLFSIHFILIFLSKINRNLYEASCHIYTQSFYFFFVKHNTHTRTSLTILLLFLLVDDATHTTFIYYNQTHIIETVCFPIKEKKRRNSMNNNKI